MDILSFLSKKWFPDLVKFLVIEKAREWNLRIYSRGGHSLLDDHLSHQAVLKHDDEAHLNHVIEQVPTTKLDLETDVI